MIKIINQKPETGDFIRVPKNIFHIKADAFKLLVWLMQHKNGFECNQYFIRKGTGMDYRTIRKNLNLLVDSGSITISGKLTTSGNLTINYFSKTTIGVVVDLPTNKNTKQEEEKQEEKQEEKSATEATACLQGTVETAQVVSEDFNPNGDFDEKELPW
jgi:hypothetical protein